MNHGSFCVDWFYIHLFPVRYLVLSLNCDLFSLLEILPKLLI